MKKAITNSNSNSKDKKNHLAQPKRQPFFTSHKSPKAPSTPFFQSKPVQRKIQVKGGALYDGEGTLPDSLQTSDELKAKANDAGTHLVRKNDDLVKRVKGETSEMLSPHRHLIGEEHDKSQFTTALSNWGWQADKMAESFQTSSDVTDELTEQNKNLKSVMLTSNPYFQVKELENLHPYMIQSLSMLRFRLAELEKNTGVMSNYAQSIVLNINKEEFKKRFKKGTNLLASTRKAALQEWNGGIAPHYNSYKRACADRLKTPRGSGTDSQALLHDMATAMNGKWESLEKNIKILSEKPYQFTDSWTETHQKLKSTKDNFNNFITRGIDLWAAELVKMTKAEASAIAEDNRHDVTITGGWSRAKGADDGTTALHAIGPMREIFMAHNINTKLNKPGLVQIGEDHVTNLAGQITDGKYHKSYKDFMKDTKE